MIYKVLTVVCYFSPLHGHFKMGDIIRVDDETENYLIEPRDLGKEWREWVGEEKVKYAL
jgi:hypothetical protein